MIIKKCNLWQQIRFDKDCKCNLNTCKPQLHFVENWKISLLFSENLLCKCNVCAGPEIIDHSDKAQQLYQKQHIYRPNEKRKTPTNHCSFGSLICSRFGFQNQSFFSASPLQNHHVVIWFAGNSCLVSSLSCCSIWKLFLLILVSKHPSFSKIRLFCSLQKRESFPLNHLGWKLLLLPAAPLVASWKLITGSAESEDFFAWKWDLFSRSVPFFWKWKSKENGLNCNNFFSNGRF